MIGESIYLEYFPEIIIRDNYSDAKQKISKLMVYFGYIITSN